MDIEGLEAEKIEARGILFALAREAQYAGCSVSEFERDLETLKINPDPRQSIFEIPLIEISKAYNLVPESIPHIIAWVWGGGRNGKR